MRKPQGFLIETIVDTGTEVVHDTVTCGHCSYVAVVPDGHQPAHQCRRCMRFLCKKCYGALIVMGCYPQEKKLDDYERGKLLILR